MEQSRKPPSWTRPLADYGPLAVFLVAYFRWDLFVATGALIAATGVALAIAWLAERRVPLMPLVTAGIVAVFGGLTLWLQDETFIKMKPTIVQLIFAAVLLGGLIFKRPLLRYVLGTALALDDAGWRRLTLRWAVFFTVMAGINELVWRTQSTDFWVSFKVFGILGLTFAFALAQMPLVMKHRLPDAEEEGSGS